MIPTCTTVVFLFYLWTEGTSELSNVCTYSEETGIFSDKYRREFFLWTLYCSSLMQYPSVICCPSGDANSFFFSGRFTVDIDALLDIRVWAPTLWRVSNEELRTSWKRQSTKFSKFSLEKEQAFSWLESLSHSKVREENQTYSVPPLLGTPSLVGTIVCISVRS